MILAGDVGGTKTAIALFEREPTGLREASEEIFASGDHAGLEPILEQFLDRHRGVRVDAASFAVAGPVVGGSAEITNLPWRIEARRLARVVGARRAHLMNDVEAAAYGTQFLPRDALRPINPEAGSPSPGSVAVIAPGTGLGVACLAWDGERHHPMAGEGGHADFAPRDEEQDELLRWLRRETGGRVSVERVLSGPGLLQLYRFGRERSGQAEPGWLARRLAREDPSAVVSEVALEGRDPVCEGALARFGSILGAEAGDLALRVLAVGGVYVAGGIAPRILPSLESGAFMRSFCDKGRFSGLLRGFPVFVVLDPRAPLIGAAHRVTHEAESHP
jgi:glucokinase